MHQEKWTRELAAWRAVVGEHDRTMKNWRKAWVRIPRVAAPLQGWFGAPSCQCGPLQETEVRCDRRVLGLKGRASWFSLDVPHGHSHSLGRAGNPDERDIGCW